MARVRNKLSAKFVATAGDGRWSDGGGLYLAVDGDRRRWLFMWTRNGRRREMGLGSARDVCLADARRAATKAREAVLVGGDPIEIKRAERPTIPTFGKFADELVEVLAKGLKSEKTRAQWRNGLSDTHCRAIRSKLVSEIDTADVLETLKPLWHDTPETASRLRGRIERVLDAARVRGFRSGENPARWRGHLSALLPAPKKLSRGHQSAMAFGDVPAFVGRLRDRDAVSARALEFLILTAARVNEVIGATWGEIDTTAKLWTIPAERMKTGREHRVPLSDRSLTILDEMKAARLSDDPAGFVFPGGRPGRGLSNMAFKLLTDRMGEAGFTTHGFRSAFRDWCGEMTAFPREVAEAALGHRVGDEVEQAYRRGDALKKRTVLMDAWALFCEPKPANVVALKPKRGPKP